MPISFVKGFTRLRTHVGFVLYELEEEVDFLLWMTFLPPKI